MDFVCFPWVGHPRRHLLTTGWSYFVSQKKLVAGDAVVFIRYIKVNLMHNFSVYDVLSRDENGERTFQLLNVILGVRIIRWECHRAYCT
mgnify:FL=1